MPGKTRAGGRQVHGVNSVRAASPRHLLWPNAKNPPAQAGSLEVVTMTLEEARQPRYCTFAKEVSAEGSKHQTARLARYSNTNSFQFVCTWCGHKWSFPRTGKGARQATH